jgi:hypothetical protein
MLRQSSVVARSCEYCGQSFYPDANRTTGMQRFCSRKCGNDSRHLEVERACAQCGTLFRCKPSAILRGRRFCSYGCFAQAHTNQVTTTCQQCGTTYQDCPSRLGRFCSRACQFASYRQRVTCICLTCGKDFETIPSRLAQGHRFCSKRCWHDFNARSVKDRFWAYVDKSGHCWLWIGRLTREGYGQFTLGRDETGKKIQRPSHRIAYQWEHGPLPDDVFACHNCDVNYLPGDITYRRCVRPSHITPGTVTDNNRHTVTANRGRYRLPKRSS